MAIITLAQTKELLGIGDTTYDAAITARIPFIDSKVKLITRNNWNKRIYGDIENGSANITVYDDYTLDNKRYCYILDWVKPGMQLTGTGIPTGAYITDIYSDGTEDNENYPLITINDNCTADTDGLEIFLGFPIGYLDIVAKGIWFAIQNLSTTAPAKGIKSKSMGPISISYSDEDSKLDSRYGMPSWFVKGLPRFHGGL